MREHQNPTPLEVYQRLMARYGPRGWWPVTDPGHTKPTEDPEGRRGRPPILISSQRWEVMVGALLTQNTAWTNVRKALAGLRERGLDSPREVALADIEALANTIRSSGYYNQKARRLQLLAGHLEEHWNGDVSAFMDRPTSSVRAELLGLTGIGPETADSILLYAGNGRHVVFVVDAYTCRLARRLGWGLPPGDYAAHRAFFAERLEPQVHLFSEYHALIVAHAQSHCRARDPRCAVCPLADACPGN